MGPGFIPLLTLDICRVSNITSLLHLLLNHLTYIVPPVFSVAWWRNQEKNS